LDDTEQRGGSRTTRSLGLPLRGGSSGAVKPCRAVALDDEQQRNLGVLLLDERGSGTGADRPPADSSVSSRLSHKPVSKEVLRDRRDGRQGARL
jgi:hypothetical protein